MLDFEINIASIITIVMSVLTLYVALTNRLTRLETKEEERGRTVNMQIQDLKDDLARLSTLGERVYVLERDTKTLFRYYDEVKADLKDIHQQ